MADETIAADPIEMDDLIAFNGIDATTGDYLINPISNAKRQSEVDHLGGAFDLKLEDIAQAGWAIIFHKDEDQAVKDALAPLIERRREQIGDDNIVKVLEYRDG